MRTCLVTQNSPALHLLGVAQLPEKFLDAAFHVAHFFDAPKGLQLPKVLQLFLDAAVPGQALVLPPSAPPLQLGLLHHWHDTQSAKRLGLLINKWLRMRESSFTPTWPHTRHQQGKGKVKLMLQKSSGKIRMPIPNSSIETTLLGISRTPKKGRLGSSLTLNDIPITRHHGNACSIPFFSNIETLSAFIYCSCHAK